MVKDANQIMDRTDYEFVNYRPEFKLEVVRLLSGLWGEDLEQNNAYFDWKYLENPYVDQVRMTLALHDGNVVGVRGFFAMRWRVGVLDKGKLCLGDADAVVHPDHRRKGLLGSMTDSALSTATDSPYEFIFTLSANKITSAFNLSLGWQNAGFIQTAKRFRVSQGGLLNVARNVRRRLRSRSDDAPQKPAEPESTLQRFDDNASALRDSKRANVDVARQPRPEEMANLIERIGDNSRIQHVRDEAYFAWRYQNPRSTYRFVFWSDNKLEGYLVLRTPANATGGAVTVVDLAAKNMQVYADLMRAVIEMGNFYVIDIWSETLSVDVKQLLSDNNFRFMDFSEDEESSYFPPQLLVRPIQEEKPASRWEIDGLNLLDINNWIVQAIDSDGS